MKKITLSLIFAFVCQLCLAQFWMEAGLKGATGTTLLYNKNIFDDTGVSYKMKNDFAVGPRVAFNFGESNGVILEGLFSQSKAYYSGVEPATNQVKALNYVWQNIDAYLMYRYYYERSFVEIGPKFSSMNKMEQNLVDVKSKFNNQNLGAAFGFGGFLAGSENISLGLSFRFDYNFSDFISAEGKTGGYPFTFSTYSNYAKTSPIVARAGLDLTFALGGTAKAQCGRRVFFFGGGR
jgi:hypothetical protein